MNPLERWRERRRLDRELAEEMASHIEERADQLRDEGLSHREAARDARRQFGNVPLQLERSRDVWGWSGIEAFAADMRFGCRLLRKSPGFTATAIVTLALSIGAATAVFSIVDSVLLRPLNFPKSDELVVAWERLPSLGPDSTGPNPKHAALWRQRTSAFQSMVLLRQGARGVALGNEPPRMTGSVTAETGLFDVLGVKPSIGRGFAPEDGAPGRDHVVVITHELWKNWFREDPDVIGKRLRVGDTVCDVIGVLPEEFRFPNGNALRAFRSKQGASSVPEPGIFLPTAVNPEQYGWSGDFGNWIVLGRLRSGTNLSQAEAQLETVEAYIAGQMRLNGAPMNPQVSLEPLQRAIVGNSVRGLWFLMASVGALLLIACLNLAGAQLARAVARHRESAVRSALGAGKGRLIRAALAENLVLAIAGGAAGVLVALLALEMFRRHAGVDIPRLAEAHLNLTVLLFSSGITAGATLLFGILPAIHLLRVAPNEALQGQSGRVMGNRQSTRAGLWLVGLEIAGCTVLLLISGIFGRSMFNLTSRPKGFETAQTAIAQVDFSRVLQATPQRRIALDDRILNNLREIPRIESAALVSAMPLEGESWIEEMRRSDRPSQETPLLNLRWVSPGYFETLRQKLVAGRFLEDRDASLRSVVLSQALTRAVWPNENPLGARVQIEGREFTVVGIVADARTASLKAGPPHTAYVHYADRPPFATFFMLRGPQPSGKLISGLREGILRADASLTVSRAKTLDAQLSDSIAVERLQASLLTGFGTAALALAMLGIYGVSYSVAGRRREIGVRIALGATRGAIYAGTFREAVMPVAGGLAGGLVGGMIAFRAVRSLLYGIDGVSPAMALLVIAMFTLAALAAGFLPARRAASVEPMNALRAD